MHDRNKKAMELIAKGWSALQEVDRVIDYADHNDKRLIPLLRVRLRVYPPLPPFLHNKMSEHLIRNKGFTDSLVGEICDLSCSIARELGVVPCWCLRHSLIPLPTSSLDIP